MVSPGHGAPAARPLMSSLTKGQVVLGESEDGHVTFSLANEIVKQFDARGSFRMERCLLTNSLRIGPYSG